MVVVNDPTANGYLRLTLLWQPLHSSLVVAPSGPTVIRLSKLAKRIYVSGSPVVVRSFPTRARPRPADTLINYRRATHPGAAALVARRTDSDERGDTVRQEAARRG